MQHIVLIDKPAGVSSFDVVRHLKRELQTSKIGYLGTLDPLATGLLVCFVGHATRLIPFFSELDKEYVAEFDLGKISDTYDSTGIVKPFSKELHMPSRQELSEVLESFFGAQWQRQPAFSALKVQGRRAYEIAREGKQINLGKRQVTIHELELLKYTAPLVRIRVSCSSGTYIRSLVHEVGLKLQTGAIMTALRRLTVGTFSLADAVDLDDLEEEDFWDAADVLPTLLDKTRYSSSERERILADFVRKVEQS